VSKGVHHEQLICASALEVQESGAALKRIRLLKMGKTTLRGGRGDVVVRDLAHARAIIAATRAAAGAQDLPIDYDHQTVFGAKDGVGGTAPAAGWIKDLEADEEGVWATVEWTARGEANVTPSADGKPAEYRYLSPVFGRDPKTLMVTKLYNAAITNSPDFDDLTRLAASLNLNKQETRMELSALAVSLGLPATATQAEVDTALARQREQVTAASTALGLAADATPEQIIAAATALKGAGGGKKTAGEGELVISASMLTDMQSEISKGREERIAAAIDTAVAVGKITPALRDNYLNLMRKDEEGIKSLIDGLPVLAAATTARLGGKPAGEVPTSLSDEQKIAASLTGVTEEAFLATLKSNGGH
jgi:phage I-like protein